MTRWKYDADPNKSFLKERIPATSMHPARGYLASFDKDSPHRPTAAEVRMIASYIEYQRTTWFTTEEQKKFDGEPFDINPGTNTVVMHKYSTDDWAYRRRLWQANRLTPPSPRVPTRLLGPWSLAYLLDFLHTADDGRLSEPWLVWKAEHQEVFGDAGV